MRPKQIEVMPRKVKLATFVILSTYLLLNSCTAGPQTGFKVQLYVDVSASAVHWSTQDNIWEEILENFVDKLRSNDSIKLYTVNREISSISSWIDNPKADDINKQKNALFPTQVSREVGTCTRDMLTQARSNLTLANNSSNKNILVIMIDEDEGASQCTPLSRDEWSHWFSDTIKLGKIVIFPLNPNNKFATFLDNASAPFSQDVSICRKSFEPDCHIRAVKNWRDS